jgi:hypothetical protein
MFTTFASAGDVARVEGKIDTLNEMMLSSQIRELQRELCEAPGNGPVRDILDTLMARYTAMTGSDHAWICTP